MRYGLVLSLLVLSGCATLNAMFPGPGPVPEGYSRIFVCVYPEYGGPCGWQDYKQVGPSSQGSFTEPTRH